MALSGSIPLALSIAAASSQYLETSNDQGRVEISGFVPKSSDRLRMKSCVCEVIHHLLFGACLQLSRGIIGLNTRPVTIGSKGVIHGILQSH